MKKSITIKELMQKNEADAAEIYVHLEEPREIECCGNVVWEGWLNDVPGEYQERKVKQIGQSVSDLEKGINGHYVEMWG